MTKLTEMYRLAKTLLVLLFAGMTGAETVSIETASNHADENEIAKELRGNIDEYELSDWMFSDRIVINRETTIPHSHPVLTLNTGYRDKENELLTNVIHEQLHWFVLEDQAALGSSIQELRERYPDAPDGPPKGARDIDSTYLHLIVCSLEYLAIEQKIGRAASEELLLSKPYYTWVFRMVVEEKDALREILTRNGIVLP